MARTMLFHALLLAVWIHCISAGFIRGQRYPKDQNQGAAPRMEPEIVSDFSLPSRCLEEPDDEDCRRIFRELQQFTLPTDTDDPPPRARRPNRHNNDASWSGPSSYVSDFNDYDQYVATSAPTKDMCYGNMARFNKKYCRSEMPSVSLEPSDQPTSYPRGGGSGGGFGGDGTVEDSPSAQPSIISSDYPSWSDSPETGPSAEPSILTFPSSAPIIPPTAYPTAAPTNATSTPTASPSTSNGLGQCEGDCDSNHECKDGLYCFHRDANQAVPGCEGFEFDDSRTDVCTSATPPPVDAPVRSPTTDICRIKLYWDASFYWQETSEEFNWCMICGNPNSVGQSPPSCEEGDRLHIHECGWDSTFFEFVGQQNNNNEFSTMVRVEGTDLCLERSPGGLGATLENCDSGNSKQQWATGNLPISCGADDEFEIGHEIGGEDFCLTTHHHPKHGEVVELFPCRVARKDNTSRWIPY